MLQAITGWLPGAPPPASRGLICSNLWFACCQARRISADGAACAAA